MDSDVNARNTALYNRHANTAVDRAQADRQRDQGAAADVKKFHNQVKRLLLQRFAGGKDRLLDLACGRGGDLLKWIDCKLKYVRGYDIAAQEIEEAQQRFNEVLGKAVDDPRFAAAKNLTTEFLHSTEIGTSVWSAGEPYDAATCMFALHYFFHSKKSATKAIELAAANLKDGGHFFGVLPNGQYVQDACFDIVTKKLEAQHRKEFVLIPRWKGDAQPFGSGYNFTIKDTVTQGEEDAEGSYEYLVYQSVLIQIGRQFDLHPVLEYPELDDVLEPAEQRKDGKAVLFRRFKPDIVGLHPSLQLASRVNCAFVFRKGKTESSVDLGKRKREAEGNEQSADALRAALLARQNHSGSRDAPAVLQNGGVTGTQQGRAENRGGQGAAGNSNLPSSLADEDDLLLGGGVLGHQINDAEQQQRIIQQQNKYKRSSRFKRPK